MIETFQDWCTRMVGLFVANEVKEGRPDNTLDLSAEVRHYPLYDVRVSDTDGVIYVPSVSRTYRGDEWSAAVVDYSDVEALPVACGTGKSEEEAKEALRAVLTKRLAKPVDWLKLENSRDT